MQISAIDTPLVTEYEVINGETGSGEFFGPWTADHDAGGFDFNNVGGATFSSTVQFQGSIEMNQNLINDVGEIQFTIVGHRITDTAIPGDMEYYTTTNDSHRFFADSTELMDISTSQMEMFVNMNMNNKNIIGIANLVASTATFTSTVNITGAGSLQMNENEINNVGEIQFTIVGHRITDTAIPGDMEYYTTTNDSHRFFADSTEIIDISTIGLIPATDNIYDIGTSLLQFKDLWINGIGNIDTLMLSLGTSINEFSTDGTLAGNSNNVVPTEQAVRTYVDNNAGGEVNTGINIGLGDGVFSNKVGVNLQFKTFQAGSNIALLSTGTEIEISSVASIPVGVQDAEPPLEDETDQFDFQMFISNSKQGYGATLSAELDEDTAIFVPIYLGKRARVTHLGFSNIVATTGTITFAMGLYANRTDGQNYPGLLIVQDTSATVTAMSQTALTNSLTPTNLEPGLYWIALVVTNTQINNPTRLAIHETEGANSVGYFDDTGGTDDMLSLLGFTEPETFLPSTPANGMDFIEESCPALFARLTPNTS